MIHVKNDVSYYKSRERDEFEEYLNDYVKNNLRGEKIKKLLEKYSDIEIEYAMQLILGNYILMMTNFNFAIAERMTHYYETGMEKLVKYYIEDMTKKIIKAKEMREAYAK